MPLPDSWAKADVIAKIAAVAIGGAWALVAFLRKREWFPRANVSHKFTVIELDELQRIVRIELTVENVGDRILRVRCLTNSLHQILPLAHTNAGPFVPTQPTSENPEIPWPALGGYLRFFKNGERDVEASERDAFHFDYLVPASVTTVQAYSYVTNPLKWYVRWRRPNQPKEIGWQTTDIFTLPAAPVTSKVEATHRTLDATPLTQA